MRQWLIPSVMVILGLTSVVTLKSVAPSLATQQAIFFVIGLLVFYTVSKMPFRQWLSLSGPLYLGLCALLVVSLIVGVLTQKTGRWIPIAGLFNLQPSQLAIPTVALLLSRLSQKTSFNCWDNLLKIGIVIGIPAVLILIEPDLGTMLVYVVSVSAIIFMSDISWKKLGLLFGTAALTSIIAWFFVLRPYQKARITSFLDTTSDPSGASYNARQALIAAGSGQFIGRGLGQGIQSHLRFLPERQTDFIFASFAEETGFVGSLFLLMLYSTIVGVMMYSAQRTAITSGSLYCYAIVVMTVMQAGVNIGMNIGVMPITGITLPLMSYGGSSVLSLSLMFGIVQSLGHHTKLKPALHLE